MRKQVIEIFSEWMAYYVRHQEECGDGNTVCRQWVETNYPDETEAVVQAVVDSYDRKPDAICSWEYTADRVLNIIIKQEKKTDNQ